MILLVTAVRMARDGEVDIDITHNPLVRLVRRFIPLTDTYYADKFFILKAGKYMATPLLIVLLVIESSDVVFAIDSIPAVFGITQNPFIVYTSNIFAILGLRSLSFLLAGIVGKFHYLKIGLSFVLGFVGIKMILESVTSYTMEHPIHIPIHWSLLFIALVLAGSIGASLLFPPADHEAKALAPGTGPSHESE